MDEGRLGAVRRRTNHNRKSVIVMNDIIKNRQEVYQNYLSKEQHGVETKIEAGELGLKRTIVRNNILMQCLEARKEKMATKNPSLPLGRYGGRPIHTFSRDIESMIAWMHPRLRRLRKVERMKQNGLRLGAIIDPTTVPARIDAVFGPGGERSNSDSHLLSSGKQSKSARRKNSINHRRRLSKTGGVLDPLGRRPQPPLSRRRIEAPPVIKAFQNTSPGKDDNSRRSDDDAKSTNAGDISTKGKNLSPELSNEFSSRSEQRKASNSTQLSKNSEERDSSTKLSKFPVIPSIKVHGDHNRDDQRIGKRREANTAEKESSWRPTLALPPIKTTRELVKK